LIERSNISVNQRDDLAAAARDIKNALEGKGKIVSLISAGVQPQRERHDGPSGAALDSAARGSAGTYSYNWRFDLGLRLAATDLLPGEKKRALIFIGTGNMGALAFEQYSLSEMAAYMANNGIVFHAVIVGGGAVSDSIRYLCAETGGRALPLYRPQGIGELVNSVVQMPSGWYTISYRSQLPTDFGRAYLPVEAEVYLMERSGGDRIGFFAPLE
jgi:hypothetical protein